MEKKEKVGQHRPLDGVIGSLSLSLSKEKKKEVHEDEEKSH